MSRTASSTVALASLLLGAGATWLGAFGVGTVPPVGRLLSPAVGLWTAARDDLPREAVGRIPGLTDDVDVRYDQRSVPHIFAATDLDAVRAMGYVVARDRLFQLELQARAGEGTLTELVGDAALSVDQETRRLGMPRAAEQRWATADTTGQLGRVLMAYAEGINAYRAALPVSQYPVEYKLLNRAPREWQPVHSLHLFNRMGFTLAHNPVELRLLRARALIGDRAARDLFDSDSPVQEPIQPNGRATPRDALLALTPPGNGDTLAVRLLSLLRQPDAIPASPLQFARDRADHAADAETHTSRAFASNNWAVGPARSANGHALLAGDPHLELTLPSIWYEVHLVVPGVLDVGGVTIPGLPGVTIGYTRDFAWSFTNTGADVMDFWQESVNDARTPSLYQLDGAMVRFVDTRIELYRNKRGDVIAVDTVYYTHRGPMHRQGTQWLSMRWTVLEAGEELLGFFAGIKATDASAFLDSMARYYKAPAQNIIVADTAGTIAIRSTGMYPIRADSARGMDIRDGRTRATDWIGVRTVAQYPQSVNPAQGYLASANQQPVDPQRDPLYLGVDSHFEIWRALQINRLLRADSAMTPERMGRLHTDPGSVRADRLMPYLLYAARAQMRNGDSTASLRHAEALLARWDRRYTRDNTAAVLFEAAIRQTSTMLYDELLAPATGTAASLPSESRLLQLFADSTNVWWDDRRTADTREIRDVVVARALATAYDSLTKQYGNPAETPWTWSRVAHARPRHVLGLEGFSAPPTPIDGGRGTLNPSVGSRRATFGASWRMVADLGPVPQIRAVYPGGQSGNPGSPRYLDRLAMWGNGQLDSVRTPRTAADLAPADTRATLMLTR